MQAPRAKFERIHVVSPVKVAMIFLTSLHCIFVFISFFTSFWIETKFGHYGPLFSCKKHPIRKKSNSSTATYTTQCEAVGFSYDLKLSSIPLTATLLVLSFILSIITVIVASRSLANRALLLRHRYWLCTTILLVFICLIDCFILVFIPLNYFHQFYQLQWAYGLHCGATLFICVSFIMAILTYNSDDEQYVETIEE